MMLRMIEDRAKHDMWMEKAPFEQPARIIRQGQILGIVSVVAVLCLAAYALYLDRAWLAAVLAGIDLIALAAVFANGPRRPKEVADDEPPAPRPKSTKKR